MNPEVVTIGLGYIGLPTSALIASHGTNVLGVDINQRVVDTINQGKIHIVEPDLDEIVSKAVSNGFFKASTKPTSADVYLIVVPTPFKGNHEPDISFVEAATKGIIPLLKKGDLYIIESTSPIGTTDKMQKLIFTSRPELEGAHSYRLLSRKEYCQEMSCMNSLRMTVLLEVLTKTLLKKRYHFIESMLMVSCTERMLVLLRCAN